MLQCRISEDWHGSGCEAVRVSTSSQIQAIRASEQRYPTDLIRHGKQYRRGRKVRSESVRRLREMRKHAKG